MNIATLREWLEHSPPAAAVSAFPPDLSGFMADGIEICAECSGRLMARGCRLGDKVEPIWERPVVCELHGEEE